jgi:Amino acid synthesis
MSELSIRKTWVVLEETRTAAGRADPAGPLRKAAACAVVRNPFAGRGYVEDLAPLVEASRALGAELGHLARESLGAAVESYGKAAIAGTAGEQEHANACLTSAFGDTFRAAIGGGQAWISSTTKVGPPGCAIDVPLAYKDELWVRSHYDALEVRVPDAPLADEIVVIAVVASRSRLNARLGGLTVAAARERRAAPVA